MVTCPACQLAIRSARVRCPRCGTLLPEAPASQPDATSGPVIVDAPVSGGIRVPHVLLGVAGLVVAALLLRGRDDLPPEPPREAGDARPQVEAGQPGPGADPSPPNLSGPRGAAAAEPGMRSGNAAYAAGDLVSAEARYREALAADPGNVEVRNNLAQVLIRLNRVDAAIAELDLVIRAAPDAWSYRFNRGRAWAMKQQWPRAIADYLAAARQFPDDYATQYNLGLAYAKTNDHASAAAAFERAVRLAPGEASFLVSLGTEYVALERYADATRVYEQYLTMAPDAPDAAQVRAVLEKLPATPPSAQ